MRFLSSEFDYVKIIQTASTFIRNKQYELQMEIFTLQLNNIEMRFSFQGQEVRSEKRASVYTAIFISSSINNKPVCNLRVGQP